MTRVRTNALQSSGLWLRRKRTTLRTAPCRQRSVRHPESTRRHVSVPVLCKVLRQRSHFLRGRIEAEGRNQMHRSCRGRRRPASDHRRTRRDSAARSNFRSTDAITSPLTALNHRILSSTMTNLSPSREKIEAAVRSIGGIDLERLFARGGVKDVNLVPFGQRGQPAVGRQDAELSAGAAGQVAAARFIFVLRVQVPAPQLAFLIQGHQLAFRGESRRRRRRRRAPRKPWRCFPASAGSSTTRSRASRTCRKDEARTGRRVRASPARARSCSAVVRSSRQRNGASRISVVYSSLRPASSAARASLLGLACLRETALGGLSRLIGAVAFP